MAEQEPRYFAYLLRVWREDGSDTPVWRASLQSPGQAERRGFAGLEELFAFLCSQTHGHPPAAPPAPDPETK